MKLKVFGIILAILIIAGATGAGWLWIWLQWANDQDVRHTITVQARVRYWKQVLSAELPLGSSRAQVAQWAKRHSARAADFSSFALPGRRGEMYLPLERLPASPLQWVCNGWDVAATITLDASGHSVTQEVSAAGDCL